MTEQPSDTSNGQRLKFMFSHLTPKGAVIPYSVCLDSVGNIWVASKGGLFKLDKTGKNVLTERRNLFPKKMAPYPQVVAYENKIVYVLTEDQEGTAEFRILDLDGNIEHEQFIDGKIQSLAINNKGEIFMTKQPAKGADEFFIYKTTMDCPLGWEELVSSDDLCFQSLCAFDSKTLVVATCSAPLNMYSKQAIKLIDSNTGKILHSFSSMGKDEGQIYFPRSIQRYKDDILMMDKTGKFQRFDLNGKLLEVSARIDAYIANGFIINGDEALIVCSGIVLDEEGHSLCDDWLELIKLDGSWWPRN